jgi:hypothetical protein
MKIILIKLFIGLVLFATLVALTVLQVPNAGRLVDLLYVALVGLGITHLATPGGEGIGGTSPNKEGGFASIPLLAMMSIGALSLAGCATTPNVQTGYVQACAMYEATFSTALQMRVDGKLSKSTIDQITLLDQQITPICTGPMPTDPTQAEVQITAAVTTLTILEASK